MPSAAPLPILAPGFRGLNTELASTVGLVDELWALGFTDWVYDEAGKLSSRKGYTRVSDAPSFGTADVKRLHEYIADDGTKRLIGVTVGALWLSTNDGATWSDITGALSFTTTDWKFVNFAGKVIGAARGERLISYNGAGTFATITASSGSVPVSDGLLITAFGRLWAGNDATSIISYCGLLNETQWASGGAGGLDASNVWSQADSRPTALAVLGSTFILFSRQEILLYADGSGSEVGIDPTKIYVVDTIEGTGCIARDSAIAIGEGDLWFLSKEGVQSLKRVIADKVNPLVSITRNVRSLVQQLIAAENDIDYSVQALYAPENNFVLYLFPDSERVLCIDTRLEMEAGARRVVDWPNLAFNTILRRQSGALLLGAASGYVGTYGGYRDDGATKIVPTLTTPWLDGGEALHNRLKALIEAYVIVYGIETVTCTLRWGFDFRPLEWSQAFTSEYVSSGAEWGTGEFNNAEFGDGLRHRKEYVGLGGDGQYVKLYLSIESTDQDKKVSLQEITLFAKPGAIV